MILCHLMEDSDIDDNPHTHCRHNHEDHIGEHNPTGVPINHEHHSPWIDMKTNRYDIRGEVYRPIQGLDKIKLSLTYADYYHDEKDAGNEQDPNNHKPSERDTTVDKGHASSIFTKKGVNGRLELYHTPTKRLSGVLGIKPKNLLQGRRIYQAIFNQRQNGKKPKVKTLTNTVLTY